MRTLVSMVLGCLAFAALTAVVTLVHQQWTLGYWLALVILAVGAFGAGWLAAWNARDAFSGVAGGILVTLVLWFTDQSSAWATAVFHAPLHSLNGDEVLLGLAVTLFGFLQGAKVGEAQGLRRWRARLESAAGVERPAGPWPPDTVISDS